MALLHEHRVSQQAARLTPSLVYKFGREALYPLTCGSGCAFRCQAESFRNFQLLRVNEVGPGSGWTIILCDMQVRLMPATGRR